MFEKLARISATRLESLGSQAAKAFLESKEDLNSSITKLASSHDLNNEQIKRVCEFANHAVEGHLFEAFQKVALEQGPKDIYYPKFKMADAREISRSLKKNVKTASVSSHFVSDYDRPFPVELGMDWKPEFASIEKEASAELPRFGDLLEKLTELKFEVAFSKAASELKIDECAHSCYMHIKSQVLKGSDIKDLYKAALKKYKDESDKRRVSDLFQLAANKLVDEGVKITRDRNAVKLAFAPLNNEERKELISDLFEVPQGAGSVLTLNGSYVNDTHPLFAELDILVKQHDEADRYDKALHVVDDKIRYVKHKIFGTTIGGA